MRKKHCSVRIGTLLALFVCALLAPNLLTARRSASRPLSPLAVYDYATTQDTTTRPQEKKSPPPKSEVDRTQSGFIKKPSIRTSSGVIGLLDFREGHLPELTFESADSLARQYPELKDYLLKESIIQGALREDARYTEMTKSLRRAFSDFGPYSELEAQVRRNQQVYGVPNNPMRPPPMPNQINLFDLVAAISNLLRLLGVK